MYGDPGPIVVNDCEVLDKVDFYEFQVEEFHSCIKCETWGTCRFRPCFPLSRNVTYCSLSSDLGLGLRFNGFSGEGRQNQDPSAFPKTLLSHRLIRHQIV